MKDRIKFMYEGGSASLIQILFSSQNMADFLNKAEYVTTISEYDRSMLDELRGMCVSASKKKQSDLVSKQQELASLQENLEAKKNELNSKISSTSG
ncbi:MAG: coiled-coil domain-containing protein [[Clostridium] scindens]